MITFNHIQDLCQIYESENSVVYRGIRIGDHQPVIIKQLKENYPTPEELYRYQQEYKITHCLNLTGVIKAYSLEKFDHSVVIIYEDFGGESLKILLDKKSPDQPYFSLNEFLPIAIKITHSLGEIHQHNIIHKDLNPSNLVFNPQTEQLKIIDFGISSQFFRENTSFNSLNLLEGTLAYLSPEQTGRINRSLDYRTDFYALGCTFYELLTGKVPFPCHDIMELIYFHLTKSPLSFNQVNPKLKNIPPIIQEIVFKLMAKTPEERYQSAWGIEQDLKYCLQQLQEIEKIQTFLLGEEDYSPQLIIPEKLYGRKAEIRVLINSFQSFLANKKEAKFSENQLLMIFGESGLGKSVLVRELYPYLTEAKAYLLEIKFSESLQKISYSALVTGIRNFIKKLVAESQDFLEIFKLKIASVFAEKIDLLLELIPELNWFINQDYPQKCDINSTIFSPQVSIYQYNLLLQKLILIIIQLDFPVVLFFDNLQWADSESLKLLTFLVKLSSPDLFLIIASRNDDFRQNLSKNIKKNIKKITLSCLELDQINLMISETFKCSSLKAYELGNILLEKTGGNPFFIKEFILLLSQQNLIKFDQVSHIWQWDFQQIQAQEITENIADLITAKIQQLPLLEQNLLKIAVGLGYSFKIKTLAQLLHQTFGEIDILLKSLVSKSIIFPLFSPLEVREKFLFVSPLETNHYQFSHQRIYQAIYASLSPIEVQENHLKIAKNLLSNLHSFEFENQLFDIVDHYNKGIKLNGQNEGEILTLINFNLLAGKQAKLRKIFASSLDFLYPCLTFINSLFDPWKNHYPLMINLYQEIATEEFLNNNLTQAENFCNIPLAQITNILDQVNFYEILIKIKSSQNHPQEALNIGLNLLDKFKINLEYSPLNINFIDQEKGTKNITIEEQISLGILINLLRPATIISPQLIPAIINTIIKLSPYPQNPYFATIAYSYYGAFLCNKGEKIETAYRLGKITLRLVKRFNLQENQCKINQNFYGIIAPWKMPIQKTLIPLKETIKKGLEIGDLEGIGLTASLYCQNLFLSGHPLTNIAQEYQEYLELMQQLNLNYYYEEIKIWEQLLITFQKKVNPHIEFESNNNNSQASFLFFNYFSQSIYYYYLKDYSKAKKLADLGRKYQKTVNNLYCYTQFIFYDALILMAEYSQGDTLAQKAMFKKVNSAQKLLKKWSNYSLINFEYLWQLIEAEKLKLLGKNWQSLQTYEKAIKGAKKSKNLQQIALSYELTAQFYLSQDLTKIAQIYLQEAHYYYLSWQGITKVKALEKQYKNLLNINQLSSEQNRTKLSTISSKTNLPELDLQSIIKAYQAISQEIYLDNLLNQIMKIVMENAGADQGILLLYTDKKWILASIIPRKKETIESGQFTELESISSLILPKSILYYVARTKENIILNNASKNHQFVQDTYIINHQPKAILCLPLIYQQQLMGILYLENNLIEGAFTPQRIELLNLLSAQAIISLQNAQFYQNLEQKVEERTAKLSQTLQELQDTQKQLIESEKMASLGSLVAGVAHEINTPVGIGVMMASHLAEETKIFMNLCESGSLKRSVLNDYLETAIESSQLILNNLQKAAKLVQSFKQVAVDQTHLEKRTFLVKEYLEEILISLQPTIKSTNYFVTIEGDEKIKIESYPGAFSQIVTNLILNSIEHAYPTGKTGHLKFKIKSKNNHLEIRYSDDGCGIIPEHLNKIFEPFFTTSRTQGGTGLGLHIVYNLVRQTLKGTIHCQSEMEVGTTFILTLPLS